MLFKSHRASVEALEPRTLLAAGALDTSFSGDGKTTVNFGLNLAIPYSIRTEDVAVQSDGKTVVAGSFVSKSNTGQVDFVVVRFNLDGTLDQSFGQSANHRGIVFRHIGKKDSRDFANAVAIQNDGKILVAGHAIVSRRLAVDTQDFAVMRLNPDGSLDKTFDGDGISIIQFHDSSSVQDIAIQSDGKIILAGFDNVEGGGVLSADIDFDFAVARLNANGSLDKSFDTDGKQTLHFGGDELCNGVALDSQGNLVLVGSTDQNPGSFALARLKPNGALGSTFDADGKLISAFTGRPKASASEVLIQPDGKLVAVGHTFPGGAFKGITARYLPDGRIDPSFGPSGAGFVETAGLATADDVIRSADGGLIVGGGTKDGKFQIVGYTANGIPRNTFGTAGVIITDFGDGRASALGLAKGPGRRFVATGGDVAHTARYLDDGANVVSIGSLDPDAMEGTSDNASLIVGRSERLSVPTRVFLKVTGTAKFSPFTVRTNDYGVNGLQLPVSGVINARPFIDIPAGKTFIVLPLVPRDDSDIEGTETAVFSIAPDPSYELGTPSVARVDIADNDQGATTNLNGVSDAYVRDGSSAGANFGSATELQVKTGTAGLNRLAFIKFDLSSVATISSAKLSLLGKLSDAQSSNVQVSVFPVANPSWSGSTITFNNKPAAGATALASVTITDNTPRQYSFDVSNYVKQEKALGRNLVSFMLKAPGTSTSFVSFVSGNAGGSSQPKLSVITTSDSVGTFSVVPPPASVRVGQETRIAVDWVVPTGGWRQLSWVKLSIRDLDDEASVAVMKFEEASNSVQLSNLPGKGPSPISLVRSASIVKASGPASPVVTVTFVFRFNSIAAGHRFGLEVSAKNDIGSRTRLFAQWIDTSGWLERGNNLICKS